jgi:hypothetical protein
MELFKHSNHRNTKYLSWLREQSCIVSGEKAQCAHHIRLGTNGGKGIKPSDYFCVPLTNEFHTTGSDAVHLIGEETFLENNKIDKVEFFIYYLQQFLKEMLGAKVDLKGLSRLDGLDAVIEKIESFNTTGSKPAKKNKKKVSTKAKVSITENEFYQKSREYKREKDKELRKSIKESSKKNDDVSSEDGYQQEAKKLKKDSDKKRNAEYKEAQSAYRKKMYQKSKELQKEYEKKRKENMGKK